MINPNLKNCIDLLGVHVYMKSSLCSVHKYSVLNEISGQYSDRCKRHNLYTNTDSFIFTIQTAECRYAPNPNNVYARTSNTHELSDYNSASIAG